MSQTIKHATELIELIGESPRTLAEMAAHFGVHRSTAFRQLQTLQQAGFLVHRPDGTYDIGHRLIAIGQGALDRIDLRRIAHDELRRLHKKVGNTIHLAQLVDNSIIYVDKIENATSVRMYSRIGRSVLPHCTGVGKSILSLLPSTRRDELLADTDWTAHTPQTLTSREDLNAELDTIITSGWSVDNGEFEAFMNCIAAPVSDGTGTVLGAISISSIRVVNDIEALAVHVPELLAAAQKISRSLS